MIDQIAYLFRSSVYLLLGISALSIGLAEGNVFPHLLTLPLLMLAYFHLDRRPLLELESLTTSILGIAALLVALAEFQQGRVNVEMRILSASHLLGYFTWIVLLLRKENQQYWWMIALSVLNMAVAASLTNSPALGVSVVCYLFLAIWTLSLFTAYRGTASLRMQTAKADSGVYPSPTPGRPQKSAAQLPAAVAAGQALQLVSRVRGGFHFDPKDNWIGVRLVSSVVFLSCASMLVGMAIFTMTPRIWIGNWQLPSSAEEAFESLNLGQKMSGFTSEVRLGDMGEILENPTPVVYVDFSDVITSNVLTYEEVVFRLRHQDLLFRGTALSHYNRGSWTEDERTTVADLPSANAPRQANAIRIRYELEPIGRSTLFVQHPANFGVLSSRDELFRRIQMNRLSQEVSFASTGDFGNIRTIQYETIAIPETSATPSGIGFGAIRPIDDPGWIKLLETISASVEQEYQQGLTDSSNRRTNLNQFEMGRRDIRQAFELDNYVRNLSDFDDTAMPRLRQKAEEICSSTFTTVSPLERCLRIQSYLRDSGDFTYTLNMSIIDPQIDPVEDFLFNRRTGHCEYFASAMTLMLRSVGVPARMVSGFKGGRWDTRRSQLVVEQRHAHAWVEAFIDGEWVVFDPTAPRSEAELLAMQQTGLTWTSLKSFFSNFWQTYVIGVSLSRQRSDIYDPILKKAEEAATWAKQISQSLADQPSTESRKRSLLPDILFYLFLVFVMAAIVTAVLLYLHYRTSIPVFSWWMTPRSRAGQQQMILFFRRFLEISARHGLKKQPHQTAREFAAVFRHRFSRQLVPFSLDAMPTLLTNAYYQARFRGDDLQPEDIEHWKVQLDTLGHALGKKL